MFDFLYLDNLSILSFVSYMIIGCFLSYSSNIISLEQYPIKGYPQWVNVVTSIFASIGLLLVFIVFKAFFGLFIVSVILVPNFAIKRQSALSSFKK